MRTWLKVLPLAAALLSPAHGAEDFAPQKFEGWLTFFRNRNAQTYEVTGSNRIDEAAFVKLGGIEQWVTIRGQDRNNPVLLVLHGGPGDATNPWSYPYFFDWLEAFTVVQWDQRGAGRTLGKTGESIAPTLTVERLTQDGIELSEYLRRHLGKNKVILLGHSWGSVLGTLMAKARPDLFHALVGTGQVVDFKEGNVVAYSLALQTAEALGDSAAVAELKAIGPPPYKDGKGWRLLHKWRRACEGADTERFLAGLMGIALAAPGSSTRDINDWFDGQVLSEQQLFEWGMQLDPKRLAGDFALPVFVLQGEHDCSTPTALARTYVEAIRAPRKEFAAIPGAGHFAAFMKPDEFLRELVARVRPLAVEQSPRR
jgi:pimeloyl-ACP methyl ester carboxylesterase